MNVNYFKTLAILSMLLQPALSVSTKIENAKNGDQIGQNRLDQNRLDQNGLDKNLPEALASMEKLNVKIVKKINAPKGLTAYAALYSGRGIGLYLTEDKKHVILGSMFDAKGVNLTDLVLEEEVYKPLGKKMWARMEKSTWIQDGKSDADTVVYVFSDPNCAYCNAFWHQSRPWVDAGKVQLRHIIVGMLEPDSAGKAAAMLMAKEPTEVLKNHELMGKKSTLKVIEIIPMDIKQKLDANLSFMKELSGAEVATPAIFYLDSNKRLQQHQGLPNPNLLLQMMGPRP